jgi:hypothetical protein
MSPRWLHWPAAAPSGDDWDTYASDNRYKTNWTNLVNIVHTEINYKCYSSTVAGSAGNYDFGVYSDDTIAAIAVWGPIAGSPSWSLHTFAGPGGASGGRDAYGDGSQLMSSGTGDWIMVTLKSDPGTTSGWRAYDGPTS